MTATALIWFRDDLRLRDNPALQAALETAARADALAAGAEDIQVTATRELRTAKTEARLMFIEGEITVEASGRPRIAV